MSTIAELRTLNTYLERAIATGQTRAEFGVRQQLQVAAVAALPALLDVAEAAQNVVARRGTDRIHESARVLEEALQQLEGEDSDATA